jgi:hypothetical protein
MLTRRASHARACTPSGTRTRPSHRHFFFMSVSLAVLRACLLLLYLPGPLVACPWYTYIHGQPYTYLLVVDPAVFSERGGAQCIFAPCARTRTHCASLRCRAVRSYTLAPHTRSAGRPTDHARCARLRSRTLRGRACFSISRVRRRSDPVGQTRGSTGHSSPVAWLPSVQCAAYAPSLLCVIVRWVLHVCVRVWVAGRWMKRGIEVWAGCKK